MALPEAKHDLQYARLFNIEERLDRLIQLLWEGGRSSPQLADELGVSIATIARDVKALRQLGHQVRAERIGRCWQYSLLNRKPAPILDRSGTVTAFANRKQSTGATQ